MQKKEKWDFGGWASKNDVLCDDGTTIRSGCFSDQNGEEVPLVWSHQHGDVNQVLGHGVLEERPEGTYFWGKFNDTESGQYAKELVKNGDVKSLSVWANKLKRAGGNILHGVIREVSLVLSGSDNKAKIDTILAHSAEDGDTALISDFGYGELTYIAHSANNNTKEKDDMAKKDNGKTVEEVYDTLTDEQKQAVAIIVDDLLNERDQDEDDNYDEEDEEDNVKHAATRRGRRTNSDDEEDPDYNPDEDEDYEDEDEDYEDEEEEVPRHGKKRAIKHAASNKDNSKEDDYDEYDDDATVEDVYNDFTPTQKKVVDFLVGQAVENAKEDSEMKHNVFEGYDQDDYISHEAEEAIIADGKKLGKLSDAWNDAKEDDGILAHDGVAGTDYGIKDIEFLFPEAKMIDDQPPFIQRNTEWVDGVLNATHRTPFSRVKSVFANITEDEARAKGYIKGKLKKDEVFTLLKRTTEPQTIYKKQRLDKDDIDDITDFSVVTWMKAEMQLMLREEVARAILIGDGRSTASEDKIDESKIRPVASDADLYTIKYAVEVPAAATPEQKAKALITAIIRSRKDYKGTGNPSFYTTEGELTEMLLLENGIGEKLYKTEDEVRAAIRARSIVTVEPMEGAKINVNNDQGGGTTEYELAGVLVNLADYNIGTNGGAKTDFFDDFDIDFNQYKYLYETRMSGALIKPYSAVSFYYKTKA